eukprot:CAMPEP_0116931770 /NCGR_PEP_ID=MMETSP0467-20121206/28014_1 /TAXON_ID=283647 /ORGANISM="Mesodinium pulex, Strain SPMC105" /LENGTH=65 /DNA_ID=CAMNT_0004612273 /DNA_START=47 /DNA_END=244 /DNA_ORIENTATION=+
MCDKYGLNEGTSNHLSVSLSDQDAFLTLPFGIHWAAVNPEDFALVGYNDEILKESGRSDQMFGMK